MGWLGSPNGSRSPMACSPATRHFGSATPSRCVMRTTSCSTMREKHREENFPDQSLVGPTGPIGPRECHEIARQTREEGITSHSGLTITSCRDSLSGDCVRVKCSSCDVVLEPAYNPCQKCKRRGGYSLIEDPQTRAELWQKAAKLMDSRFQLDSLHAEPNIEAILRQHWWVAAAEGSLTELECARIAQVCADLNADELIGVLIERIYETTQREGYPEITELTVADFTD